MSYPGQVFEDPDYYDDDADWQDEPPIDGDVEDEEIYSPYHGA